MTNQKPIPIRDAKLCWGSGVCGVLHHLKDRQFSDLGFECDAGACNGGWETLSDKERAFYFILHALWMARYDNSVPVKEVIDSLLTIPEISKMVDSMEK